MTQRENTYKLPGSWSWVKLNDISLPIEKAVIKYMNPDDKFRYIDIESIDNNSQNIKNAKFHTWKTAPSRARQIIQTNDILFATVRPYLKNIAVVTSEYNRQIASSGFCVIHPSLVNYKYIFYFIQSDAFVKSINKLAKGTSYPAVTNRIVLAQQIPLPPFNEQLRIVSKIEELLSGLAKSKEQLELAFRQIQFYKQSILKEIYASAAIVTGAVYIGVERFQGSEILASILAATVGLAIRLLSIKYEWQMPKFVYRDEWH